MSQNASQHCNVMTSSTRLRKRISTISPGSLRSFAGHQSQAFRLLMPRDNGSRAASESKRVKRPEKSPFVGTLFWEVEYLRSPTHLKTSVFATAHSSQVLKRFDSTPAHPW